MSRKTTIVHELASCIQARLNCKERGNDEWYCRHSDTIDQLTELLPSGSGFDSGTKIDLDRSTGEKIVMSADFHHMNDGGYYDGWTEHTVTVRASLLFGIDLSVSGRNRNDIKDYIHEVYQSALLEEIEFNEQSGRWELSRWLEHKRKTAESASV